MNMSKMRYFYIAFLALQLSSPGLLHSSYKLVSVILLFVPQGLQSTALI